MAIAGKCLWFVLGFWFIFLAVLWLVVTGFQLPGADPPVFVGQVNDENGPVAGARVRLKGHRNYVLTDALGQFRLPVTANGSSPITAAKEGYVITATPASAQSAIHLQKLPIEDWNDYDWVDPVSNPQHAQNCGNCHKSIFQEWSRSGHARSSTGRRLLNIYDGTDWHGNPNVGWNLLADNPAAAGVCNACHAPTVSFEDDLRSLRGVAGRGVHCDFCHKISESPMDNLGLSHGRYALKLLRPKNGQLFFASLDDVDRNEDSYSPLYKQSKYCASCHEGVLFGVPVYSTYSEWLQSPAKREGKHCQSCHMAPTGKLENIAPGKGGIRRNPWTLASHQFPGGQPAMLRRCLQLLLQAQRDANETRVKVEILARDVGHRVPTGFVDRNLILVVEALDSQGNGLESRFGPKLPELAGKTAGLPGKVFAKKLKDFEHQSPVPFWRADSDYLDSRLFPGEVDQIDFQFPAMVERIRLRLIFHRFWPRVAEEKKWPDNELLLIDETILIDSQKVQFLVPPKKVND